jgi:hypothetical protein
MNTLTQADRDRLTTAYTDALDRHLRYMAEQRSKQTITVQGTLARIAAALQVDITGAGSSQNDRK